MNREGAGKLGQLAEANPGRSLALVLDGEIIEQFKIRSKVSDAVQITGDFDALWARQVVTVLRGGSLPVKLKLVSQTDLKTGKP